MPDPTPHELESVAVHAAGLAAETVRRTYGSASSIGTKSSATDVVTATDLEAERLIRSELLRKTPGAGFIGEEEGAGSLAARLQWVIDPLDGTVNFLYGLPVFAVSVAAAIDGRFVAGCVVDVLRREVFAAHVGGGARLDNSTVHVSPVQGLGNALVATGYSYDAEQRARQGSITARLLPQVRDIRGFGSAALHLCWVACGRLDAYFERDIKIWDWAAGALIAEEAGATIELGCPENDGLILAASPRVFDPLRAFVG